MLMQIIDQCCVVYAGDIHSNKSIYHVSAPQSLNFEFWRLVDKKFYEFPAYPRSFPCHIKASFFLVQCNSQYIFILTS